MSAADKLTDTYLYQAARDVTSGSESLEDACVALIRQAKWGSPSDDEINRVDRLIQELISTQRQPQFAYILAELNLAACQTVGDPSQEVLCANTVGEAITQLKDPRMVPRRIEVYKAVLDTVQVTGDEWREGVLCNNLGNAYSELSTGDLRTNMAQAVQYFERALRTFTRVTHPYAWAVIQNNIATIIIDKPGSDDENIRPAIDLWSQALQVLTRESFPMEWANIQRNLGIAYKDLNSGDPVENLIAAEKHISTALEVLTLQEQPILWAEIQNSLGNVYFRLTTGDKTQNLQKAMACFERALTVRTAETFPAQYASTCVNLGNVWLSFPGGDLVHQLREAITCYEQALAIYSPDKFPEYNAQAHANLAAAYLQLPAGDRFQNLRRAEQSLQVALGFFTRANNDAKFAWIQTTLGAVYREMAEADPGWVSQAIDCYEEAAKTFTAEQFPADYALAMDALGTLYPLLPEGDPDGNYRRAELAYQAALTIYRPGTYPDEFASTQTNLGNCYLRWPSSDRSQMIPQALSCYQKALSIHTRESYPVHYAQLMDGLGVAYGLLAGQSETYWETAVGCFREATEVATTLRAREVALRVAGNAGSLAWRKGEQETAHTYLASAIRILEAIWDEHYTTGGRQDLQKLHGEYYRRMVDVCYRLRHAEEALTYAEQGRSRDLLMILGDTVTFPYDASDRLLPKLDRLNTLTYDLHTASAVIAQQKLSPDHVLRLIEREAVLRTEKERLLAELAADLPEFVALRKGYPLTFNNMRQLISIK